MDTTTQESDMINIGFTSEEFAAVGKVVRQTDPGIIEMLEEDGIETTDEMIGKVSMECDLDEFEDILNSITF
jgi:hypothetical protein